MSNAVSPEYAAAVAIVGMSGRFPGADGVEAFWRNLTQGTISINELTDEELLAAGVDPALLQQPNYVKAGTRINAIDCFDAPFFGYSAREAELMDPQHRLFLEVVWEALENAGYSPEAYRGQIGVFAGSAPSSYRGHYIEPDFALKEAAGHLQLAVGNDCDSLASTVSYKLNLRGPSVAVQTFCSTSLVAVHMACQSLLVYESDLALAGGVAITFPHGTGYLYSEGDIVSPDGRCRTFDAQAQGSVMGNGIGVVALKRFEDALSDGDHIYAIIRGSAVNNDGIRRVGYTAPGLAGQSSVMVRALHNADVKPDTISYVEAHGTATPLGDSIELAAMIKAYQRGTTRQQFCAIGSVKPNIGHLDRASGVTGLIKTTLALKHTQLPPSLNFERTSPDIDLASSPFYVNTALREWTANGSPRRAGVSSFGLGGTNAHVILEEAPRRQPAAAGPDQLIILSAKTAAALETMTANLAAHLRANPELNLADVAYTLQVGRVAFNHRRALVCAGVADALHGLEAGAAERLKTSQPQHRDRPVALFFPGQLYESAAIGELYALEGAFRAAFDAGCDLLDGLAGADVRAALGLAARPVDSADLDRLARPLALLVEYALAQLFLSWGLQPQALLGVGLGEYAAACVAGVLTLEDALSLLVKADAIARRQPDAAPPEPGAGVYSPLLRPALAELAPWLASVKLSPPQIPLVSGATGATLSEQHALDPGYWLDLLCRPARLAEGLDSLWQEPSRVLLAVGAAPAMSRREPEPVVVALPPVAAGQASIHRRLLAVAADLWLAGVRINWPDLCAEPRQRVPLPTYPFERQRYWVNSQPTALRPAPSAQDLGKQADIGQWFYLPAWKQSFLPRPQDLGEQLKAKGPWLLLVDDSGFGDSLARALTDQGGLVVVVRAGPAFAAHSETSYTINPDSKDDYQRLLGGLRQRPKTILHLWSLTPAPVSAPGIERFNQAQRQGLYALLYLTKAIGTHMMANDLELWIISQDIHRVSGAEDLQPEHATLASARLVVAQESLNIQTRHIDSDRPAAGWQQERLIAGLLAEFAAGSDESAIAYRGGERWIQVYDPIGLPEPAAAARFRQEGVYLITGGLGNVGMALAEHLAAHARARLVLTTRAAFPAAGEWPAWLESHPADDPVSQKIRAFEALEALGAEVLVAQADVADEASMRRLLETIHGRFGALHGVIHTAGISDDRGFAAIQTLEPESCELHFGPKVRGLYVLETVLAGQELDFCILFSSLAAILGGIGFFGYTAANSFMDAFAQRHNLGSPQRWVSVNWDTWMLKENPHGELGQTVLGFAMSRDEALQAFERVAASGAPGQLVLSTGNLAARFDQWVRLVSFRSQAPARATVHPRPELMTAYVAPSSAIEEQIVEIWQTVLGVEVGVHDNFLDLGGNSLIGTQVVTRLRRAFQVDLPLTILFDAPTVEEMAIAIEMMLIDTIEALGAAEALSLTQA